MQIYNVHQLQTTMVKLVCGWCAKSVLKQSIQMVFVRKNIIFLLVIIIIIISVETKNQDMADEVSKKVVSKKNNAQQKNNY